MIALHLHIELARTDVLTILRLLIHEHGISLHLFSSPLISFISLQLPSYRPCTYFVRFIPKYFIWGDVNVNYNVFSILVFTCSLLVYKKKTINFCITLYPEILLFLEFSVSSLGFSTWTIMSSKQFYFFLLNLFAFYFLFLSKCISLDL